ncbi:MAG: GspH/FimT family pseudopilin [Phycisphaerae bacterium]|nr:GspH/FimT family pseudopilin [Phycisphaerae bacterium]
MGKRGAFTLVELLTVVVLLGVVAAVVLPHAGYSDREKALLAAKKVAADIEYAQGEAVNRQASVTISFSPGAETYSLTLASGGTALTDPLSGNDFNVNLPGDLQAAGVDLNSASFGGSTTLTFNAYGEPVQSDGTPISAGSGVVVRCGDSLFTVSVAPVTGRVTVVPGT